MRLWWVHPLPPYTTPTTKSEWWLGETYVRPPPHRFTSKGDLVHPGWLWYPHPRQQGGPSPIFRFEGCTGGDCDTPTRSNGRTSLSTGFERRPDRDCDEVVPYPSGVMLSVSSRSEGWTENDYSDTLTPVPKKVPQTYLIPSMKNLKR